MTRRGIIFLALLALVRPGVSIAAGDVPVAQPGAIAAPAPGQPIPNLPKLPPVSEEAFHGVTQEAAPLTPAQIRALHRYVDDEERAAAAPPRFVPKPVSSSVTALLTPGATPPVVRLSANFVTSVLFIDQFGSPLNVIDVTTGGADAFTITWTKGRTTNKIDISPKSTYANGNVSVLLEGTNNTPVSLTLVSGQREVDYRVDVRVKGRFVSAANAAFSGFADSPNPLMLSILDGVAPDGAHALTSSNPDVQAWTYQNRFYVRTSMALLSPAFVNRVSSADGTTVYEIPPASDVVLLPSGGSSIQVSLSGY